MSDSIPFFRYHPYPLNTCNASKKIFVCICCNMQKSYAYSGPVYTAETIDENSICLDCIANGYAADKLQAEFASTIENHESICPEKIKELYKRTPGYNSWQGDVWLTHCHDICSFHGDFKPEELQQVYCQEENKKYFQNNLGCNEKDLDSIIQNYQSGKSDNPAFYKFECLVCKKILVHTDFT